MKLLTFFRFVSSQCCLHALIFLLIKCYFHFIFFYFFSLTALICKVPRDGVDFFCSLFCSVVNALFVSCSYSQYSFPSLDAETSCINYVSFIKYFSHGDVVSTILRYRTTHYTARYLIFVLCNFSCSFECRNKKNEQKKYAPTTAYF